MKLLQILLFLTFGICSYVQISISLAPASNGMNFSTRNEFITDSGGQGGTGYSDNKMNLL